MQATAAILEGLYWLQEALRLVVEEVSSKLVEATATTNFWVSANLDKVVSNLG